MIEPAVNLRTVTVEDAPALTQLRIENRMFFQPFEPERDDDWYTVEHQCAEFEAVAVQQRLGRMSMYGIVVSGVEAELVGWITLSCIERGVWQNCNLGYAVAQSQNGRGVATAAVRLAVAAAFEELDLHRVQAAVMPSNAASIRVLAKNGLRREGYALRYLKLAGRSEDHDIVAITNDLE